MKIEPESRKRFSQFPSSFVDIPAVVPYIGSDFSMLAPKKSLGQHFLRDENVARKIVESLRIGHDDVVVEIGPGTGALTKHLVQAADRLIGLEIDKGAIALLTDQFQDSVEFIQGDVLEVDLHELGRSNGKKLVIVGNIPYNITSEILFWLFKYHSVVSESLLMMQLEVARRLVAHAHRSNERAHSKDYGILSVFTAFHTEPEFLFKVSRNSFYPKPNVDSAVVRLRFKDSLPVVDMHVFKNVVRSTFGQRRKTLRNGLRSMGLTDKQLDAISFDLKKRPENLDVADFVGLANLLKPFEKQLVVRF